MDQLNLQALEALALANRVRSQRALDKKAIKRGEINPAAILRRPPKQWESAKLVELFVAIPHVGRVKASKWCRHEAVAPSRTLSGLSERQRFVLARHIDTWAARRAQIASQMGQAR